jgi:hypothetical protein
MRATLLAIALLLAVPATAPADPPAEGWVPGVEAARAYAQQRAGEISFHLRTEAEHRGLDADRGFASASVVKAMLMVAYLSRPGVRRRALEAADHALIDPMIRRSDNVAATRVRDIVGDQGLRRVARRAGMRQFSTHPVWGLSRITARDQTRMWLRFEQLVPRRHRPAAMELLRTIVPSQRWGIGQIRLPAGWELFFKGGWGSGTGLVDHQVALLRRGRERVALAILTAGNPSHEYGKETLRGVAARLLAGLPGATAVASVSPPAETAE